MYPFAQSVIPEQTDPATTKTARLRRKTILQHQTLHYKQDVKGHSPRDQQNTINTKYDIRRISAVADMQFGLSAAQALFKGKIRIVKSKKTQKIRNVYADEHHIVSMRAHDGLFTLKKEGGQRLHDRFPSPQLRVIVHDDAVPFVKEGKSVFAKFVLECDPNLLPYDECLIVDSQDTFLTVGRCVLNRQEMLAFSTGIAAKTRESNK